MESPPRRETLPRSARMRSRAEFDRVFARRLRASDGRITLCLGPTDLPLARLGITVGRRFGNAVHRNRIKRLIREAFRRLRHDLPPGTDWIVIPRPAIEPTVADLQDSLRRLSAKLHRRLVEEGII